MTNESWRASPPSDTRQFMVFRQLLDDCNEIVLKQVKVPAHMTLDSIKHWLRLNDYMGVGVRYTVMSVATVDVFEKHDTEKDGVVVSNVESTVY